VYRLIDVVFLAFAHSYFPKITFILLNCYTVSVVNV
jgi:hypothetical protein